jgi:hypothetical protein
VCLFEGIEEGLVVFQHFIEGFFVFDHEKYCSGIKMRNQESGQ